MSGEHILRDKVHTGETSSSGMKTYRVTAWCGEKSTGYGENREGLPPNWTSYAEAANVCSKCSSKFWTDKLKREPNGYHLGERYNLSDPKFQEGVNNYRFTAYKSVYPVFRTADNEQVAFIVIENGWGENWKVMPYEAVTAGTQAYKQGPQSYLEGEPNFGKTPEPYMSKTVAHYTRRYTTGGYLDRPEKLVESLTTAVRFPSKEYALAQIPSMMDDGHLMTYTEAVDKGREFVEMARLAKIEDAERKAQWARDDEARRQRKEREAEERDEHMEFVRVAFEEMLYEGRITNYQREAVFTAAKLLGIKVGTEAPLAAVAGEEVDVMTMITAEPRDFDPNHGQGLVSLDDIVSV